MDYDRLRELQTKFDENPRRYFAPLANEYRKGGNPKRAIEICRAHLAQMPGHMSGQVVFGQALLEGGEYEEARKVFEGALVLDPENLIALRSLGDLSLQAGATKEARSWYTRLLEADPKDAAVIALIAEIDSAPPTAGEQTTTSSELTVDFSFVDNPPAGAYVAAPTAAGAAPPAAADSTPPHREVASESRPQPAETVDAPTQNGEAGGATQREAADARGETADERGAPPLGLEHHYPTGDKAPEAIHLPESTVTEYKTPEPPPAENFGEPPEPMGPDRDALDWSPAPFAPDETAAGESVDDASSSNEGASAPPSFVGANPEPFVNETMAQLYLQQGYKQLALRVYRQLAERKPQDQSLTDRIAEIEASQAVDETPGRPEARREEAPSVESPTPEPAAPRAPSTESPAPHGPEGQPSSVESPGTESFPVDSPPTAPSSEPDSIESPVREEPRAEPEGIAARQPSMKEFFATLGRRRPAPGMRSSATDAWRPEIPSPAPAATDSNKSASLDTVFAGAKVSSSDARAASTLAGAFSVSARATSPPLPTSTPTPRANPRLQTQESEEDVAKFRAWLDGLTGE